MRFVDLEQYTFSQMENYTFLELELLFGITDRTLLDVQRVKDLRKKINETKWESLTEAEKTEWINGMKGSIKASDLNRIENNLQIYSDMFNLGFTQKFDWTTGDFPTVADFTRIHSNTAIIRNSPYGRINTINIPQMPINTYSKINNIEKIIVDTFKNQYENEQAKPYCGEIYCGEYGLV